MPRVTLLTWCPPRSTHDQAHNLKRMVRPITSTHGEAHKMKEPPSPFPPFDTGGGAFPRHSRRILTPRATLLTWCPSPTNKPYLAHNLTSRMMMLITFTHGQAHNLKHTTSTHAEGGTFPRRWRRILMPRVTLLTW